MSNICQLEAKPGSRELLLMVPWIAELPKGVFCQAKKFSGRRIISCKKVAGFLYVDIDGTLNYFCRNHLDTYRIQASSHGNMEFEAEEERLAKWFNKNVKVVE